MFHFSTYQRETFWIFDNNVAPDEQYYLVSMHFKQFFELQENSNFWMLLPTVQKNYALRCPLFSSVH
jgi:hypothetical protein